MNNNDTKAGTLLRLAAAAAIVVSGLVHLQLYFDGYRDVPDPNFGRSFLLNGFGSMVVAAALLIRRDPLVRVAGIGLVTGTLVAFALSRSDRGVFGFTETGFEPSPQAVLAVAAEIFALVALLATFVPRWGSGRSLSQKAYTPAVIGIVVGTVVMSVLWNQDSDPTEPPPAAAPAVSAAGEPAETTASGSVPPNADTAATIAGFAFDPASTTIGVGATITWTNTDGVKHTVDSDDDTFVSEPLSEGDTFAFTFATAGTFPYICGIHPSMAGTITVTG